MAAHLGKTIRELNELITTDELIEWQAFDQLDPIGGYRSDLQAAMIAMCTAKSKDTTLSDFLVVDPNPMTDKQREQHEIQQQHAKLEQSTARMAAMFDKDK